MSVQNMEALGLFRGDTVLLTSDENMATVCIVLQDGDLKANVIRINQTSMRNLAVNCGDEVTLSLADIPYAEYIRILPSNESLISCDVGRDMARVHLLSYFEEAYRPLHLHDHIVVQTPNGDLDFKVVDIRPYSRFCVVAPATEIVMVKDEDLIE
eukprot:TRINITY_DN1500_c0_g1_i1.p1 TRINITY_DN1500_c0_g1~~TRINITY_DN1500_c0_g1_i1.p1  ORF type:complete len:155 (+),score=45.07 TRINITY_DN1500_c0_g1_i1:261-725(+)